MKFTANYRKTKNKLKVRCRSQEIQEVKRTTFLGFMLDKNLNWKAHVNKVCNRLVSFMYCINLEELRH